LRLSRRLFFTLQLVDTRLIRVDFFFQGGGLGLVLLGGCQGSREFCLESFSIASPLPCRHTDDRHRDSHAENSED